jgi:hypothetical protein
MKCQICGRKLTARKSLNVGIGPECQQKYANGIQAAGSSVARIEVLASTDDARVTRWLHFAKRAIGAGRIRDAKGFIEAAERSAAFPLAMAA